MIELGQQVVDRVKGTVGKAVWRRLGQVGVLVSPPGRAAYEVTVHESRLDLYVEPAKKGNKAGA